MAGFAKSVLVHRHAYFPHPGAVLDIGRDARLPASFDDAFELEAPRAAAGAPDRWEPLVVEGVLRLWDSLPTSNPPSLLDRIVDRDAAAQGIATLARVVERFPDQPAPKLWLGLACLRWMDWRRALAVLDALCLQRRDWSWSFIVRMELDRVNIRYADALKDGAHAARLDPGNAWIPAFQARVLFQKERSARGLPYMDRALAFRGRIRFLRGQAARSIRDLEKAVSDARIEYSWLYHWKSESRARTGDLRGALVDAKSAVQLEPGRHEFQSHFALITRVGSEGG